MQAKFAILVMAVLLLPPGFRVVAQEVSIFELTDYAGHLESQNLFKMNDAQSTDVATSLHNWSRQTELGLTTHGYIYHPKLFDFELDGGIAFNQNDAKRMQTYLATSDELNSSIDAKDLLWNMNMIVQLLKQKPYPVTLFYTRSNPLLQTGIEGSFSQLNENYGMNMQLVNVLPANLTLDASRNASGGQTLDRIIDNIDDRLSFRANRMFTGGNRAEFNYELDQMDSRNGDPRRDLVEIVRLSQRTSLTSNWGFGADKQFLFTENASYAWADNPHVNNLNLAPTFRWQHTPRLNSNYLYTYIRTERPDSQLESTAQSAIASVSYTPLDRLNGTLAIGGDRTSEAEGFLETSYGGNGRASYSMPLFTASELGVSGGLRYQLRDRESSLAQINIFEESHQLIGTMPVTLNRDFVVTGSIVVRNETGSQTFIEDVDYRVLTLGVQTQIERLLGGSILSGDTVLVDYAVETGGTFGYSLFNQEFSADLTLARYYTIFARYSGSEQSVTEGFPTHPLNSVRSIEVGTQADLPLPWLGLNVGGSARIGYQDEDINPFNRAGLDAYVQAPLPYQMTMQINARYSVADYRYSIEDQNLIGINGNLDWNVWRNLTINAEGYFDRDNGGSILRNRTEATLRANWHFRRISLSAEAKYSQETQGDLEYDNLSLWLTMRRELF